MIKYIPIVWSIGGVFMSYDYLTINFATVTGVFFLLIFLSLNASLDKKVKSLFYLLLLFESIEALVYSLELWTSTFEQLSIFRLLFSAVGYSVRPVILYLILCLTLRTTAKKSYLKLLAFPLLLNFAAAFSVFFTDIVYSYSANNLFHRGPLGFFTHVIIFFYLIVLIIAVLKSYGKRSLFETFIILVLSVLIIASIVLESILSIRTIGRTVTILSTIFYYMFFQSQIYRDSLSQEQALRQKLEQTSRTDSATGLLNKKAFIQMVCQKIAACPESNAAFLFLDLDHLKELNDTLGHATGDDAIQNTAAVLQNIFRKTDLIGRFGGDEFCIFILDIPKNRFYEILSDTVEKLRKSYSNDICEIHVTTSIGAVYASRLQNHSYDSLMQLADKALYEAKNAGRNCYVSKEL